MSTDQFELDQVIYEKLKSHCAAGDQLVSSQQYDLAIAEYNKAWKLVPEPKNEWTASTWILAAIADSCFLAGYEKSARDALEYVMTCPGAIGNPFLHLRYGQILFNAGVLDKAADELMRAYMGAGADIFASEDAKYLAFLKSRVDLKE